MARMEQIRRIEIVTHGGHFVFCVLQFYILIKKKDDSLSSPGCQLLLELQLSF